MTGCQPDAVIDAVLQNSYLTLAILDSYMDFDDYETPVKSFLDDRYLFKGTPAFRKQVRVYLRENEVNLADSLIPLGQSRQEEFINVDRADTDLQVISGETYLDVIFVLSPEKVLYNRDVFSFFDLFGLLGGVFELLSISLGLIVGFFSKDTLLFSIFKRLYHTDIPDKKKDSFDKNQDRNDPTFQFEMQKPKQMTKPTIPQYKKFIQSDNIDTKVILNNGVPEPKKRVITDDSCAFDEIDQASGIAMNYQAELPEEEKSPYPHKAASNFEEIERHQVDALRTEINHRRKYNTSFWQKVESVLNPILLCKTKRQKDRMKMHHNAETTYYAELDCVEIIKSIRELKVVTKMILDQHQSSLIAFSKRKVISAEPLKEQQRCLIED